MSAVPLKEIVEALREAKDCNVIPYFRPLADRIEQHGIAPPDGMVLIPHQKFSVEKIKGSSEFVVITRPDGVKRIEPCYGWIHQIAETMLAAAPEVSNER